MNYLAISTRNAPMRDDDFDWVDLNDPDTDEDRYKRICKYEGRWFVVAYAERDDRIRIISARRANRHE